jgi:iron complex outermembrane receptor protein
LTLETDGLTAAGLVPGLNQALPFPGGKRDSWGLFAEFEIPVFSPDYNLPAFHAFSVTAAVRHESLDPGGDATVPKVGIKWQPVDEQWTVRGSYSESFIAPTIYSLFGPAQGSVPQFSVQGVSAQYQTTWISNPDLQASKSYNYTAGIVLTPKFADNKLTVSVDYYNVEVKGGVFRLSEQSMVDDLNAYGSNSQYARYFQFDDGSVLTTPAPNQITESNWGNMGVPLSNGADQWTSGLDIMATYRLDTEQVGSFTFFVNANVLFYYKYADPVAGGPYHYEGEFTDNSSGVPGANGTLPDFVIIPGVSWEFKDFTYTVNAKYIPEVTDLGDMHASLGSPINNYTLDGSIWTIPSYFTIDMQVAYEIGKSREDKRWFDGTRLAVGVYNITDEDPPFISSSFEDNTDKATYDLMGRFVYFEVSKKF